MSINPVPHLHSPSKSTSNQETSSVVKEIVNQQLCEEGQCYGIKRIVFVITAVGPGNFGSHAALGRGPTTWGKRSSW
ncbi:hypothetical protein RRG08_025849 [Elysia crispata]|uniref:Uncharacterized protein n=1 Tax=Elysia crispata TaxID=231223 RepID=A0AAE1CRV8_9GAST|nr:hypothetical protein RRG08_025849 [Elysia crispata]